MSQDTPALDILIEIDDEITTIRLIGSADMDQSEELSERVKAILETNRGDMVIDMSELTFICSICLSSILTAYTETVRRGNTFKISGASPAIHSVLEVTHLDRLLESGEPAE